MLHNVVLVIRRAKAVGHVTAIEWVALANVSGCIWRLTWWGSRQLQLSWWYTPFHLVMALSLAPVRCIRHRWCRWRRIIRRRRGCPWPWTKFDGDDGRGDDGCGDGGRGDVGDGDDGRGDDDNDGPFVSTLYYKYSAYDSLNGWQFLNTL